MIARHSMLHRTNLLGLPVDRCTHLELRAFMNRAFDATRAHRIVTLNPEIALAAWRDPRYMATIRTADLVTVDGIGVTLALRLHGVAAGDRITGTHLLTTGCAVAAERGHSIAFLLRHDGLTAPPLLRAVLQHRWPSLDVLITMVDPACPLDRTTAQAIAERAPAVLIVAFGHPFQEQWIAAHVDAFPSVRIAIGVGGAVDYLSGAVPLPSRWVRRLGIEWCWRFLRQPWRWRRIVDATVVFPLLVVIDLLRRRIRLPRVRPWPRSV